MEASLGELPVLVLVAIVMPTAISGVVALIISLCVPHMHLLQHHH